MRQPSVRGSTGLAVLCTIARGGHLYYWRDEVYFACVERIAIQPLCAQLVDSA